MATLIITSEQKEYIEFLAKSIDNILKYNVKGIAMVVLTDTDNLTGYWNMELKDKAMVESEIRYDVMDEFILNNLDRYSNNEE